MNNQSTAVGKEQCPRCAKRGNDTKGDNLAVYSDGHKWCFACGFYIPSPANITFVREAINAEERRKSFRICRPLPSDVTNVLPSVASMWLGQYKLRPEEYDDYLWSESRQLLIWPHRAEDGTLLMWSGRNMGNTGRKYHTEGNVLDNLRILGEKGPIILVEDVVSAKKVSRHYRSMPLFSAWVGRETLMRLRDYGPTTEIGIWLDRDKARDAIQIKNIASELGCNAFVVISNKDPKEYEDNEITEYVEYARFRHEKDKQ